MAITPAQSKKTPEERLAEIRGTIQNAHKDVTLLIASDKPPGDIPVIPSGSLQLDRAMGVGGYPQGRVVEIYGPESSGKTTLMLHAIASAQRSGGVAAFVDAEHALDLKYAKSLGVDPNRLIINQPDHGEQALEVADAFLDKMTWGDIVVVDSVASLVPKAEIEGEIGDQFMGLQARMMSQALRRLVIKANQSGVLLMFTNQIRMKIGVMFGSPETTAGGNALKFYASVRLDIRRIGTIKGVDGAKEKPEKGAEKEKGAEATATGNRTRVKVVKNKVAPPFTEAEFTIKFGEGIDTIDEMLDLGVQLGIIEKSGGWYAVKGQKIGNGKDNVIAALRTSEWADTVADIDAEIRSRLSSGLSFNFATDEGRRNQPACLRRFFILRNCYAKPTLHPGRDAG